MKYSIMKQIPNVLTLLNLLSGCIASILMIKNSNFIDTAIILLCLSLIFDFFDGFAARLTGSNGDLGKQLDSLADMISFGFFPGILMMLLFKESISFSFFGQYIYSNYLPFLGLLITLFSAIRLAKFNIDQEQTYYFKGLNTPANTIFIFSLFYIHKNYTFELLNNFWFLLIITFICSYLLIANLPLFSLKFKSKKWKDNSLVFSFIFICLILFIFLKVLAIPLLIIIYIILSIIFRKKIIAHGTKTT